MIRFRFKVPKQRVQGDFYFMKIFEIDINPHIVVTATGFFSVILYSLVYSGLKITAAIAGDLMIAVPLPSYP